MPDPYIYIYIYIYTVLFQIVQFSISIVFCLYAVKFENRSISNNSV